MHIGNNDRKVGEQEKLERLVDDAECNERLVEYPIAPEEGNPGDHANDVRCPEGNGAQQEETDLPQKAPDVEHEEVRNGKADEQGDGPNDERELDGAQIKPRGKIRLEELDVIVELKRGHDVEPVEAEKAHRQHDEHGDSEKHQED